MTRCSLNEPGRCEAAMPRSFWSPLSELQRKARLLADDLAAWKNAARAAIERSGGGPPAIVQDRLRPFCMALDGVWTPGAGSAYFSGWMWDPSNSLADLALVLPGGVEAPVKLRLTSTSTLPVNSSNPLAGARALSVLSSTQRSKPHPGHSGCERGLPTGRTSRCRVV